MADEAAKEARRRKIRQLEASLFDQGSSLVTGLPELQRVDEYTAQYGLAERTKAVQGPLKGLPALKKNAKRVFLPDPRKKKTHKSEDDEDLLLKNQEFASPDTASSGEGDVEPLISGTPSKTGERPGQPLPRRHWSLSGSGSQNLLKSEVAQLDESIRHLVTDPKKEVLENIKRRHNVKGRSPSLDSGHPVTQVAERENERLGRATMLSRGNTPNKENQHPGATKRQQHRVRSVDGSATSRILAEEQADLEKVISKLDPRFVTPQTSLNPSTSDPQLSADWPAMPEIKASFPVRNARKDALQPLPKAKKKAKDKKNNRFSLNKALSINRKNHDENNSIMDDASIPADPIAKASRLPAIGQSPLPVIKVNPSVKRSENDKTQTNSRCSTAESDGRMVFFDDVERIDGVSPADTFRDVPSALNDVPNALADFSSDKTFDQIPKDVFDAIPSAVSAREGRRLERQKRAREEEKKKRQEEELEKKATQNDAVAVDLLQEKEMTATESAAGGAVSLITALFPHVQQSHTEGAEQQPGGGDDADQVESDFLFALFIQEKEHISAHPQRTDRTHNPAPKPPDGPEEGHFCAPFLDGFCEAHFCVIHHPMTSNAVGDDKP